MRLLLASVVWAQIVLYVPSVTAECCPTQAGCQDRYQIVHPYCFNCERCETIAPQHYCGMDQCNFFGCDCGNCIPYDPNAWCIQPKADEDRRYLRCYVMVEYTSWIKEPANWVNNTKIPGISSEDGLSSYLTSNQHVKSLVSLVRPNFTDDPLTKAEFVQLAHRFLEVQNRTEDLDYESLEQEFAKLDLNNNGLIHLNEIDPDYLSEN